MKRRAQRLRLQRKSAKFVYEEDLAKSKYSNDSNDICIRSHTK